ncbi:MAG TPA: hypothetical protein VEB68_13705 [Croceibacterium sp.]|nr:hypothetical protein [Croceibacterium sp.]
MALNPVDLLRKAPREPEDEPPRAPLAGTRSQSMQRLQVGLFGLGAMILLVGLANVIMTNAQQNQARVVPEAAPTVATEAAEGPPSDPLADAGVVPDLPAAEPQAAASPPPATGDAP